MHRFSLSSIALASLLFASSAFAQDPAPAPPAAASCTLGSHPGIDDVDAQTTTDVVCHELARQGAAGAREVRMGRLGGRILLVVDDKRVLMNGLEEVPAAATRIASASAEGRPVEETQNVDAVVGVETRAPKVKPGQMGFKGGVIGALPAGIEGAGAAPGIALGLLYRANRLGIDGHLRVGGGGGTRTTLTHVVLGIGPHYYFSDGDFSPYVGAGVGLMSFKLNREPDDQSVSGTGFGGYVELGVEALRTHHASLTIGLRADIPAYSLKGDGETSRSSWDAASQTYRTTPVRGPDAAYVAPVSLMVGMIFH